MSVARFIPATERALLLEALGNPRDRLLATLGFNTGMRISSLLSLRWSQLLDTTGRPLPYLEVSRRHLKGGRARWCRRVRSIRIPLNHEVAKSIQELAFQVAGSQRPSPEAWVFASRKHFPGVLSRRQAHHLLVKAAARAGLTGRVAPHSLRRTFAGEIYVRSGLVETMTLLGHRSPVTTAAYLRPEEAFLDHLVHGLADPLPLSAARFAPVALQHDAL